MKTFDVVVRVPLGGQSAVMEQPDVVVAFRRRSPLLSHYFCCQLLLLIPNACLGLQVFHASSTIRSPLASFFSRVTPFLYRYSHDRASYTGVQSFLLCG